MENSNSALTHQAPLSTQRYNHQMQPTIWSGNKVGQNSTGQNSNLDPYSQQMNHYYQAQYPSQTPDLNRYVSPISKDQNSNPVPYSQYPVTRQPNYPCTIPSQNYQGAVKNNCNNMYYGNMNVAKNYPPNIQNSKKYANSSLGLSQPLPQNHQVTRNTATPMPQMPHFGEQHSSYSMQNMYVSNYNVHGNSESDQSYMLQPTMTSQTVLSAPDNLMHSASLVPSNQVSQVSSIPTPPETSSLTSDGISVMDSASTDGSADSMKMNVSNSSFVLPGSVMGHLPNSMPSSVSSISNPGGMSARNSGNLLQPPANLDEGSQASSASASSSIPDEQNSVKTNSKPNFSYPPTPNTLSSPGAASMSSFHDDLECISSPGWPKTPASPVANSNYEFANIKRPENLLKLYTLSDESDRRYFLDKLIVFNEDRGSPITQCPTISKQPLDVFRVYLTVKERGGFVEVTNSKRWKDIAGAIGVGASSSAAYTLRKQYMKLLLPFECKFDRGGIDPQPIINMVEASSRKKGKNSPPGGYGNQGHYGPGYAPSMERYHSGYSGSYQSSRYPCNNNIMDYQCAPNAMHYPPNTPSNVPHNAVPGQSQFNQYSHGSTSNYRYYQGNNSSASAGYNSSNMPNSSSNLCRYERSATSTPVPQEQGYYSHQYPTTQQGQNIQDMYNSNRGCSVQENHALPASNSVNSDIEQIAYSSVNNTLDSSQLKSDAVSQEKATPDNFGNLNADATLSTSTDTSQDSKLGFNNRYNANKNTPIDQNPSTTNKPFLAAPNTPQPPYQQSIPENPLNKSAEGNYYPETSPLYPNRNHGHYLNSVQNSYPNQKLPYPGDYPNKNQMQSSQYSRFSDSQNEPYRGSEGPPSALIERSQNVSSNDGSSKPYQYNCASPKIDSYAYPAPQQGHNKDPYNNMMYNHQYNSRPQRAWLSDQNQHAYQQVGQRPQLKNQLNPSDPKTPETSRSRKSWYPNLSTAMPAPNQNFLAMKSQPPQSSTLPAPPGFQSVVKKPLEFPPNCIESIRPVAVKRRRCPAKRLGSMDPWRLMLALKSGLLAECTWALDAISILLADNSTVVYFNLDHLPGLLTVLVDHFRCFLNKIFDLAKDLEIKKADSSDKKLPGDLWTYALSDMFGWEGENKILDAPNFTYKTRCKKKVEIQYDEALFLIDPQHSWDLFEDFDVSAEHWQKGGGDITAHIQTCFAENVKKIPFCRELESKKVKEEDNHIDKESSKIFRPSLVSKGEPIVVLNKFNFTTNSDEEIDVDVSSANDPSNSDKKTDSLSKDPSEKISDPKDVSEQTVSVSPQTELKAEIPCDTEEKSVSDSKIIDTVKLEVASESSNIDKKNCPQLRGSLSSRKRFLCEDLEDEAYCFDQPALCVTSDSQEMLSRRCVCVSTILRNLSFVPGNDIIMSKNPGVLVLLGRLLLLHHEHKPTKNAYHKYEKEADGNSTWNESCISLKDEHEWWWSTLNVLRDNTLVILSNISGHLDLSPFPEEVSLPILDGLLHWVVCPSSYAQDPLPSRSPSSVLSPQRLCLETLCKLSVLSNNVDLIIATPPWSRIENLLTFLTKSLSLGQDQILREFSVVLLSNISQADSVAARTIAETNCCISYLIAFIEEAEANAFQIASSQGTKKLRDKPELMGTTPGMVQRAANTLKNLAVVPENRVLFMRHEPQLLSLVMSQVMDQELAAIISDVLFYCSDETMEDISGHLPIS